MTGMPPEVKGYKTWTLVSVYNFNWRAMHTQKTGTFAVIGQSS